MLIDSDEYLSDKEKAEYQARISAQAQEHAESSDEIVDIDTTSGVELLQTSGKSEEQPVEVEPLITNREYLEGLSDEQFVEQLLLQVYIYGDTISQHKLEQVEPKLLLWLQQFRVR